MRVTQLVNIQHNTQGNTIQITIKWIHVHGLCLFSSLYASNYLVCGNIWNFSIAFESIHKMFNYSVLGHPLEPLFGVTRSTYPMTLLFDFLLPFRFLLFLLLAFILLYVRIEKYRYQPTDPFVKFWAKHRVF